MRYMQRSRLLHDGENQVVYRSKDLDSGPLCESGCECNSQASDQWYADGYACRYMGNEMVVALHRETTSCLRALPQFRLPRSAMLSSMKLACQQAQTDSLTGVYNHRRIQEKLDSHLELARQHGTSVSVIIAEIDHLQLFSDVYGVSIGEAAQRLVADSMQASLELAIVSVHTARTNSLSCCHTQTCETR